VGLSPLGTAATSGLLYKPQMIEEGDCCSQESEQESRGHCRQGLTLGIITREPVWLDYMYNRFVKEVAGCCRNMNPSLSGPLAVSHRN
jgi:hypothetical protein